MRLPKILDPEARDYRVRYAIVTILRDRIVNEGAFKNCFEMEDGEEVVHIILRRGLKNLGLRAALQNSHLVTSTIGSFSILNLQRPITLLNSRLFSNKNGAAGSGRGAERGQV
jgi:hypothetical protein